MSDETRNEEPAIGDKPEEVSDQALDDASGGTISGLGVLAVSASQMRSDLSTTIIRSTRA